MKGNPVLVSSRGIILYLTFWFVFTIIYFFLLIFNLGLDYRLAVTDSLVFNILLMGIGFSLWYPARFIPFEENTGKAIVSHSVGAVLMTSIWIAAGYFISINIVSANEIYRNFFWNTLTWRILLGLMFYVVISLFYYIIIYYSNLQERLLSETELKNLVTQAELRSLKFQINPHFIFNSLNSMSALTAINPEKARMMILKLAEFLRFTLVNNDTQKNKLRDELKNIKLYLEIEKIRFEDKFDYVEEIQNECLEAEVPNMILQPIFENAIKHAVYETLDKIQIRMFCSIQDNFLRISVKNNFEETPKKKSGAGVGLKNIENRLKLIYGPGDLLKINKDKDVFEVILYIPVSSQTKK
ncbi:MAG: histidine kinase [Ignavibacteriaceae bacterium]|nr:histidine kinase [Ignavibacteriaceae bacterium]